mmetsp:Transcript_115557/g.367417  ORF Transcript_115557/g.367417 Transcript_115557/m.367417 type:complete len:219 (-) Transcript_115557:52-708(-)
MPVLSCAASRASIACGKLFNRVVTSLRCNFISCSSCARRDPHSSVQPEEASASAESRAPTPVCVEPLLPPGREPCLDPLPGPLCARGAPSSAVAVAAASLPCGRSASVLPRLGGLTGSLSASSLGCCCRCCCSCCWCCCCCGATCGLRLKVRRKLRSYSARRVESPKVSKASRMVWNTSAAPPLSGCVARARRRYAERTSASQEPGPMPSTSYKSRIV